MTARIHLGSAGRGEDPCPCGVEGANPDEPGSRAPEEAGQAPHCRLPAETVTPRGWRVLGRSLAGHASQHRGDRYGLTGQWQSYQLPPPTPLDGLTELSVAG